MSYAALIPVRVVCTEVNSSIVVAVEEDRLVRALTEAMFGVVCCHDNLLSRKCHVLSLLCHSLSRVVSRRPLRSRRRRRLLHPLVSTRRKCPPPPSCPTELALLIFLTRYAVFVSLRCKYAALTFCWQRQRHKIVAKRGAHFTIMVVGA